MYGKLLREHDPVTLEPAAARKLIEGAVAFARAHGLPPHRDYPKAMLIFGDVDPNACGDEFAYGKNGKPFSSLVPTTDGAGADRSSTP